ncbi:NAD(P)H-hydrate dehydratase [Adhaeribacter pallidiroseus]|uniref:Bifunctional NAD(P)H-hydrate repair enzyme n=1 Tax=Adhaeribacter pallidiroseus TaxID=2072847 RepID=A0A369QV08_9BACT|nr:NAD(P)H-hydrate dehydratase [Adhaeribacter pallidiroseus]RDC66018.1 ADP-dependent NAD(P)H-hydrate dehydratase [Adhaeribacter pallidiroseus]
MKILTAAQTRLADAYTAEQENITSLELMERAVKAFLAWFEDKFTSKTGRPVLIFCGPGNNGGDGLAIARLLHQHNYNVQVFILSTNGSYAPDFKANLNRLPEEIVRKHLQQASDFPEIPANALVLDTLFGTGLNRPLSGFITDLVQYINQSLATVIAVDMPTGLFADAPNAPEDIIIEADFTLSFELPKLAFLLPSKALYVGEWTVVPIGLSVKFISQAPSSYFYISPDVAAAILKPRPKYGHKGSFGHALLISGSYGKMGATVLSSRACLRSGVGLLTVYCPSAGYFILQTAVPEAMTVTDPKEQYTSQLPDISTYNAIGIGPGLGKASATHQLVKQLLETTKAPLVIDADALNIISEDENLKKSIPPDSILTPHPKEFERLAGIAQNDYHRLELLKEFCQEHSCYVVLKGAHTCIGTPVGTFYFNSTGNPGMATGGTGDVLTGIITALVAQHYSPLESCIVGVYLHGLAGDLVKAEIGEQALLASDMVSYLGKAFLEVQSYDHKKKKF